MREAGDAVVEPLDHGGVAVEVRDRVVDRLLRLGLARALGFLGQLDHGVGGGVAPDVLVVVQVRLGERIAVERRAHLGVLVVEGRDETVHRAPEIRRRDALRNDAGGLEPDQPGGEFSDAGVEIGELGLRERHLAEQLDGGGALLEELGHGVALVRQEEVGHLAGDVRVAEADVRGAAARHQHLRAQDLGGLDGLRDLPALELRRRGEPGDRDGLLRDGGAVAGAEGAGEVLDHGGADGLERSAERAGEEAEPVLFRHDPVGVAGQRDRRGLVLARPVLVVGDGERHVRFLSVVGSGALSTRRAPGRLRPFPTD